MIQLQSAMKPASKVPLADFYCQLSRGAYQAEQNQQTQRTDLELIFSRSKLKSLMVKEKV
jgi:hypothetical protein